MINIRLFLLSWILFVAVDMVWLGLVMQGFYNKQFGALKKTVFGLEGLGAGLIVWGMLTAGLMIFVMPQAQNLQQAVALGALFGGIVYGTYDLTNFATLVHWPLQLLFVDWAWGFFVNGLMAGVIYTLQGMI